MLIAAGAERLDRALTVGQMQGKFQLLLVAGSGHAVQEDCPLVVSGALSQLARRFRIGEPPMRVPLPAAGAGRVLPVVAGPVLRAPGGTASAATGAVARVGGASFGAVEEEDEEEDEAC
jgi:protein phosphatase methylesterase 1